MCIRDSKFNGQVVKISSSSTNYINPMDINLNYSEDDNPVALKADSVSYTHLDVYKRQESGCYEC